MKIFVDFEATQPGNEIIEIGAVAETGEEFHTYVRPRNSKITPFIEKLTGITQETVDRAPSPQSAFDRFREWIYTNLRTYNYSDIEFIAYGDSDKLFLTETIQNNLLQ
jgi:DNA polymerase III epsilon subunit-like protein